ncbi:MAG: response regulator transcription factor [Candidatus Dormibacteria bacterium]
MELSPILVVEDDELVRSFLCRALTGLSGDVDDCATGAGALRAVARRRYGAILLDGLLPDIHGIELARELIGHRNASHSGICFVSGSLRTPFSMRSGVSALPKPLRLRELLDAVGLLLTWHHGTSGSSAQRLGALEVLRADLLVS